MKISRRNVLTWGGITLALPGLVGKAFGATARKRFIGVLMPNGAYMPAAANGNWTFAEALQPLTTAGLQNNSMIIRGLFNGASGADPHWENTASFLSCRAIQLGNAGVSKCGKSVDQFVADAHPTPLRSLEVGPPYYHIHPLTDHPGYSNDYLNRISWQTDDKFRSPISDPKQMFDKLFARDAGGAARIAFLHSRKLSVLDQLHKDADRMANRLPSSYRPVLDSYMSSVRDVETELVNSGTTNTCTPTLPSPTEDFSTIEGNYVRRYQLFNSMVVLAMQCNLTNAATFMYGPSSSFIEYREALGPGANHHGVAHHRGDAGNIARLKALNLVETGLFADLVSKVKAASLLPETLILGGSEMSDGDTHATHNLPMVLCGEGADLKLGQEIGSPTTNRPLSDLHMDIMSLLGVTMTSFGEGPIASTGMPTGIKV